MAYTALASKSDGDTLTASHLNAVASNIEFLYGLVQAPNPPFHSIYATGDSTQYYALIHRHDYLLYRFVAVGGSGGGETSADAVISYSTDGSTYSGLTGGSVDLEEGTHVGYADVSGLTLDEPYYLRVVIEKHDASSVRLCYLFESSSDSI